MKSAVAVACLCVLLLGGAAAGARELEGHPAEKIIGLLQDLMAKVKAEAKAEANTFAKFTYWCKNSVKTLEKAIEEEKATIEELTDKISGLEKAEAELKEKMAENEAQQMKMEGAGDEAEKQRAEEAEIYKQADADFTLTISAIDEAIAALLKAKGEVSAVQLSSSARRGLSMAAVLAPVEAQSALAALLQQPGAAAPAAAAIVPDILARGDYVAHQQKYKFKSDSVIELLKQLKSKFSHDKLEATKAETNAINGYELAKLARANAIKALKEEAGKQEKLLAEEGQELADAKAALKDEQEDLEADSGTLAETEKTCSMKNSEWEERSKTRELELEAMAKAIEIIAKITHVRTEPPSNPVPPPSPLDAEAPTFLQLGASDPKMKAVNFLRAEARVMHSRTLERLAQEVAAHLSGPFDEVKQMIQKMIFRLMAEQKDEDDHKNWCDLELSKTNTSKINKEDKIAELTAAIDTAEAKIKVYAEDIKAANDMIASIEAHVAEATEIRNVGKEENAAAVADAQEAQKAIAEAVAVLESFYKETGMLKKEPWEFIQEPVKLPETPATWDAGYTGVTDPSQQPDGIIAVMTEISADFAKMEADTKAQEVMDQKAYDAEMSECAIEKARRTKEIEMKEAASKRLQAKMEEMSKRRKEVQDELDAVNQYLKDLEPACVTADSTYEDRKAARTKEIEALRQAQNILEDAFKQKAGAPAPAAAASFLQARRR